MPLKDNLKVTGWKIIHCANNKYIEFKTRSTRNNIS